MVVQRRGFLAGMAGILAAASMPSIIAGGLERGILMPGKAAAIWVPDQNLELPRFVGIDMVNEVARPFRDPNTSDGEWTYFVHPKLAERMLKGEVTPQAAYRTIQAEAQLFGKAGGPVGRASRLLA